MSQLGIRWKIDSVPAAFITRSAVNGRYCITFEREDLGLEVDTDVILEFDPDAIEVVSIDHGDMKVFLESLIYKGAYNEMIVYSIEHSKEMILHSMLDEQVATDIGIRFKFDRFKITPVEKKTEV